MYEKYLRPDITFKILSNYPFFKADIEENFEKFKSKLYDVGVYVKNKNLPNQPEMKSEKLKIKN